MPAGSVYKDTQSRVSVEGVLDANFTEGGQREAGEERCANTHNQDSQSSGHCQ